MTTTVLAGGEPAMLQALRATMRWTPELSSRLIVSPLARTRGILTYTRRDIGKVSLNRFNLVGRAGEELGRSSPESSGTPGQDFRQQQQLHLQRPALRLGRAIKGRHGEAAGESSGNNM